MSRICHINLLIFNLWFIDFSNSQNISVFFLLGRTIYFSFFNLERFRKHFACVSVMKDYPLKYNGLEKKARPNKYYSPLKGLYQKGEFPLWTVCKCWAISYRRISEPPTQGCIFSHKILFPPLKIPFCFLPKFMWA